MTATGAGAGTGEVHIISRDGHGEFLSSHQIYVNQRHGTARVDYCGRTYFAYWSTLDWLQYQAYEGHRLGVEYSNGKAWHLICRNPQDQIAVASEAANSAGSREDLTGKKHYSWIELLNRRSSR